MTENKAKTLLEKYVAGLCTEQEKALLETWYVQHKPEPFEDLKERARLTDMKQIRYTLLAEIGVERTRPVVRLWQRITAAAASILFILSIGGYFYLNRVQSVYVAALKPGVFKNEIQPGSNNAILTLGNGAQIILKNSKTGLLANQGNTSIQKTAEGQIKYKASGSVTVVSYNTVTTRRADKYDVTLPDGTIAYLDAASSIHFPTAFAGKNREVTITGQVYFEVAHDKRKPFRVRAGDEVVEVLGTHFNINAYDDEPMIKTTLLEGSVKIKRNAETALLVPGQQALIKNDAPILVSNKVDLDEVMAWKNGLFKFNDTELPAIMRQLTRWYNVDVEYRGPNKAYHFGGYISRDAKLTSVLKILQLSGVKFSIDGTKLIVYR